VEALGDFWAAFLLFHSVLGTIGIVMFFGLLLTGRISLRTMARRFWWMP
jgi:hypothetical protein